MAGALERMCSSERSPFISPILPPNEEFSNHGSGKRVTREVPALTVSMNVAVINAQFGVIDLDSRDRRDKCSIFPC
jgi:hypothetical protein